MANIETELPSRLRLDGAALVANWRWFQDRAAVPAAAAVKADGYGLGAQAVTRRLAAAGCRIFCVATWAEAAALPAVDGDVLVLHGFIPSDAPVAAALPDARPVLSTMRQVADWVETFGNRPADLMVDTGMARLGVAPAEIAALPAFNCMVVHSHLACADEPGHAMTGTQLRRFREVASATPNSRHALANSAGICEGRDFSFDFVRPGLGIYGGLPHPEAQVRRAIFPEARVLQVRTVAEGESVGYGGTWLATVPSRIAIINMGYADGLPRVLQPYYRFHAGNRVCAVVGRLSMDLTAVDVTAADVTEGDWLMLDFDLPQLASTGLVSQYELLTGLSRRYQRIWS